MIEFMVSCSKDKAEPDTREFIPKQVIVGFKSGTDINRIFDFINLFDHRVSCINTLEFTSSLPSDNLQYVVDKLNEKIYTNDGMDWLVVRHLYNNKITIYLNLYNMDNVNYQK